MGPLATLVRQEQLLALRQLTARYGVKTAAEIDAMGAVTESQRHFVVHGHRLRHGCCRPSASA